MPPSSRWPALSAALPDSTLHHELAASLAQIYGWSGPIDCTPLASSRNQLFQIRHGGAHFILRRSPSADLLRHADLTAALKVHDCGAEYAIPARSGSYGVQLADHSYLALFHRSPGRQADFTQADYADLGIALARFHRGADQLPSPKQDYPHFQPGIVLQNSHAQIEKHLQHAAALTQLNTCTAFLETRLAALESNQPQHGALQSGLCHGDPHPLNFLIHPQGNTLIDLEDACYGPRLYDLAVMVWSTLRQSETRPLWSAALQAYHAHLPLADEALAHLAPLMALRQLWWLAMHAKSWGAYPMHRQEPHFIDAGVELLQIICQDACGMT